MTTVSTNRPKLRNRPAASVPERREAPAARSSWAELLRNASTYLAAAVVSSAVLAVVLELWRADLSVPMSYDGDALWAQSWIKGIAENGWYLVNPRLGAPGTMELYDFPQADNLHFLLLKLLVSATGDATVAFNLYFLLGFPLIAVSTTFVLRRFGVSRLAAIASSLLFSFLPYHFFRGQHHLFLASYFLVPLSAMVVLWVHLDRLRWPWSRKDANVPWGRGRMWGSLLTMGLVASSGVYYAFFTCFLLLVAGLASLFDRKKWRGPIMAGFLVCVTGAGVLANLWPSLAYRREHGPNADIGARVPQEAEVYGLKIGHLLLSIDHHFIGRLNPFRQAYDLAPSSIGEKGGATLGAVGSAGFLFLIALVLCRTRARQGELVPALVALNIAAVLLATIGGFGSLFALLVTPQIRCYNRISVFIALFSLFAVAILVDRARVWWQSHAYRAWQIQVALVLLTAGGLFDEIGRGHVPDYQAIQAQNEIDGDFVRGIEDRLPDASMVYQLPYLPFPESPPLNQMVDYDPLRLYLHSTSLRFSYAAVRGREVDHWQRELSGMPIEEQLRQLVDRGFSGLAIDRFGYADHAAELERQLTVLLSQEPLISTDGRRSFFTLPVPALRTSSSRTRVTPPSA